MRTLWNRFRARSLQVDPLSVTVYTRPGCGCCLKALAVLEGFQDRRPMRIEVVDVDGSEDLKSRYGMEVPVVLLNGKVRFRGSINPAMLERLLNAETNATGREEA